MNAIAMPVDEPIPEAPVTRRFPGNKGIWVGITCELVEFLVLFIVYFVSRAHFPMLSRRAPSACHGFPGR